MTVVEAVRRFIAVHAIPSGRIVVACSGGFDSTALLLAFADLRDSGFAPVAAHVNHHLRGAESDEDQRFVEDLCARIGVPIELRDGHLDRDAVRRAGVEAAAREVRERSLHEIAQAAGTRWIATAHQQNDQAETVLMRLATGTGVQGLRGIHAMRDDGFIRPLLECTRADIESFLLASGITARHDSSNDDPRFLRNRVRAALRDLGTEAIEGIARVATEAAGLWAYLDAQVTAAAKECVRTEGPDETRFRCLPDDPWLARALLLRHVRRLGNSREVTSTNLTHALESIASRRRVTITKDVELVRHGDAIVLRRRDGVPTDPYTEAIAPGQTVALPGGRIVTLRRTNAADPLSNAGHTYQKFAVPDGAAPVFTVRNRLPGDRVRLLGAPGTRKLKDVLIDRKISAPERDRLPMLICDDAIVWIAEVGVAEQFKIVSGVPAQADVYEVSCEHS